MNATDKFNQDSCIDWHERNSMHAALSDSVITPEMGSKQVFFFWKGKKKGHHIDH